VLKVCRGVSFASVVDGPPAFLLRYAEAQNHVLCPYAFSLFCRDGDQPAPSSLLFSFSFNGVDLFAWQEALLTRHDVVDVEFLAKGERVVFSSCGSSRRLIKVLVVFVVSAVSFQWPALRNV
jgi:hypothetical protein